MKDTLCLFTCCLVLVASAKGQKIETASNLTSLVETERTFSRTSEEKGTRESFLAFIAEDGILFRPAAVKGKRWMLEHPLPPSQKRSLLKWQPSFADVAAAGDLGYTFGPWEYKEDIKDEKPVAYGNFITVWKRQADSSWRFVIDLGVSHAAPQEAIAPWQLPANYKQKSWNSTKIDLASARNSLISRDREFSGASSAQGAEKAFLAYSAADVRVFRNAHYPFVGSEGVRQALPAKTPSSNVLTWQPLAADVSQSGDLGYTHGTYTLSSNGEPQKVVERGNYLHIWKKHNGVWKVMVDVADPLPLEDKKN